MLAEGCSGSLEDFLVVKEESRRGLAEEEAVSEAVSTGFEDLRKGDNTLEPHLPCIRKASTGTTPRSEVFCSVHNASRGCKGEEFSVSPDIMRDAFAASGSTIHYLEVALTELLTHHTESISSQMSSRRRSPRRMCCLYTPLTFPQ
ncbi:hypothetical protein E1B28_013791 [Marasmius oreades]|uniref:Uncharacterized protein n=1 Tax=Marasmius oreades TaxID=181124 RepID=A0A9P7RRQ4_9AGAR|nr:uncharacterized protein E1B28_013791 [Marasmius oreades]KAG7087853.1 hypothetical protein E1B28_013791 [Marasmius oreades]